MTKYCVKFSSLIAKVCIGILVLILTACDSTNDIPIQQVEDSNQALEQLQDSNPVQRETVYYFGFDLRSSPQEDAAQYLPFLSYLERTTGYQFKLHFTPKNSSTADELGRNITQFASMGATSYLDAKSRYDVTSLVRGINHEGKAEYQSVLVIRNDSPIHKVEDIKGKSFAFGSRSSTQGHLIPRIILTQQGLTLKDLARHDYTGSHQNCAESVVSGKHDVCGMQDQLADKLVRQGQLKILFRSSFYPSSGIVSNNKVPVEVTEKVKQALVDFDPQGKHSENLYHWEQTEMPKGFVAAQESDYSDLRSWSVRLGFVNENGQQTEGNLKKNSQQKDN